MCYIIHDLGRTIILLQHAIGSHNSFWLAIGHEQNVWGFLLSLWLELATAVNLVDSLPMENPALDLPARYVNANSIYRRSTRRETSLETFESRNLAAIFLKIDIIDIIMIAQCFLNPIPFDPDQVKKFKVTGRVPEIEKYSSAAILFVVAEKVAWNKEFALIIKQPSLKDVQLVVLGCILITDYDNFVYTTWNKLHQFGNFYYLPCIMIHQTDGCMVAPSFKVVLSGVILPVSFFLHNSIVPMLLLLSLPLLDMIISTHSCAYNETNLSGEW